MAIEIINKGVTPGDNLGDKLNVAFTKVNANFQAVQFPSTQTVAGTVGGSFTSGYAYNVQEITGEAATEATGSGSINGWKIKHTYGGATLQGARQTFYIEAHFTSPSSTTNVNKNYVPLVSALTCTTNDGGTGVTSGTASGSIFGFNPNVRANSGATNLYSVCGQEVDVQMAGTSTAFARLGQSIVAWGTNVGAGIDAAMAVAVANGSTCPWKTALLLGGPVWGSSAPLATSATVIKAGAAFTIANGIDLSNLTITGHFLKSPGFSVDGTGKLAGDMSGFVITADGSIVPK